MSDFDHGIFDILLEDFRSALADCEGAYHSAALAAVRDHAQSIPGPVGTFVSRMLDLHRGVLIKAFTEMVQVDRRWSSRELDLAAALFEHVWGVRLEAEALKEALRGVQDRNELTWSALLAPFTWLPPFQERCDQVHTAVLRVANLVAKADGQVKPAELRQLEWLEGELSRILRPIPLAESRGTSAVRVIDVKPLPLPGKVQAQAAQAKAAAEEKQAAPPALSAEEALAQVLAECDELIGMSEVKTEIRGLINFLKVQKARAGAGLPETNLSLHAVFSGNPGTGKTTIARLLGRIFGALGLLSKGQLIETDRSGLVAEYAGQTGPKTNKRIDEALDGVLFIDEAYSLVAERGDDPFGAEALQTLLKRMEDDRARLVVVLAGYPQPLERLLKSNPGLSSRFSRHLRFPDYSASELGRIFEAFCRRNRYELPAATRLKLLLGFDQLVRERDEHFGNARLARNVFERAIRRLANRIAGVAPLTHELLTRLDPDDIELEGVSAAKLTELAAANPALQSACPGCGQSSRLPPEMLGRTVRCQRCGKSFLADWCEVKE
jgi:SpoVK/Ycf46/Vps4 family AAA+-type ATPase